LGPSAGWGGVGEWLDDKYGGVAGPPCKVKCGARLPALWGEDPSCSIPRLTTVP